MNFFSVLLIFNSSKICNVGLIYLQSETLAFNDYFIPYKTYQLYVKSFNSPESNSIKTVLLLVHWMDVRGHRGNTIYDKIGSYFANRGIPVFLFDVLGSGKSKGPFEYPQQQKDQIVTVHNYIQEQIKDRDYNIIPIVHSISAVAIMCAINEGLPVKRLIWLGGPPSHANSIKRGIKSDGIFNWYVYRFFAFVDIFSGKIGFPLTRKLFGFRLRLHEMYKSFSKAHGAKMMLPHKELDILAIFGTKDEYLKLEDIDKEFPKDQSAHITRILIDEANHGFQEHISQLLEILDDFVSKQA